MINNRSKLACEIWEKGRSNCSIVDMHAHMFNLGGAYMIANTPEKVLSFMERANVRIMVFAGHRALFEGTQGIADDLAVAKKYPERFRLYYPVVSPIADPIADLESVDENQEYVGFKFLCDYYNTPLSDKKHEPYWRYADEHHMPVLAHTWKNSPYDGVEEAEKVLARYPNLSFIAGHSFRGDWEKAVLLAQKYENLYLEMTAVLSSRGGLEQFIDGGLIKRIVFGVDSPWFSYDAYVGALLSADISDDDRKDILYRNAYRIFEKANIRVDVSI